MKKALKWIGIVVVVLLVAAGGFYGWASSKTSSLRDRIVEAHDVDFPVPFPLTQAEIAQIRRERIAELETETVANVEETEGDGETATETETDSETETATETETETETDAEGETATDVEGETQAEVAPEPEVDPMEGVDLEAIALERAIARGEHLVKARYACVECHGQNFGGGEMINDPAFAVILGPNLTTGEGGRTADYTVADWDHSVRHGVLPSGHPSSMPADDYQLMSDQELSDIIAYLRTVPPVDNDVPRPEMGPVGTVLTALGKLPFAYDLIHDHDGTHAERPPETAPTAEFGQHLAGVCTGCHRQTLNGGPIPVGPPDWIPARNLTPHAEGLADWEYDDFVTALRELRRPDGTELRYPMTLIQPYAAEMTDVELQALWAYLQSVEPMPTGTAE